MIRRTGGSIWAMATAAMLAAAVVVGGPPAANSATAKPAAAAGKEADAGKEKKAKERKIKIEAPDGSLTYDDTAKLYVITNAKMELPDSDAVLTAAHIEYSPEEKWAKATGKPRMWDPRNELTADAINVDLKTKRANADGSVRMVARPKEAKSEQSRKLREKVKEPVIVTCDTAQYFYKDKRGTATGNLKITQRDSKANRTATATRLAYDGNEETVTLDGDVHVSDTKGQGFDCEEWTFNIKEGAEGFRIKGLHGGTFYIEDEGDNEQKPSAGGGEPKPVGTPPAPTPEKGKP